MGTVRGGAPKQCPIPIGAEHQSGGRGGQSPPIHVYNEGPLKGPRITYRRVQGEALCARPPGPDGPLGPGARGLIVTGIEGALPPRAPPLFYIIQGGKAPLENPQMYILYGASPHINLGFK